MTKIIVISGATASGKSNLALNLAIKLNCSIFNADSMQIYKGLPILSAQPSEDDYKLVNHKLYSILEPNESNTVYKWLELLQNNIEDSNDFAIVVGGTGMYISRLINGIKFLPESNKDIRNFANNLYDKIGWDEFYKIVEKIDDISVRNLKRNDKHRIIKIYEIYEITGKKLSYFESLPNEKIYNDIFHINLNLNREILYKRCEERFKIMLNNAVDEVNDLLRNYIIKDEYSITKTIGFKEIRDFLNNKISYEEMFNLSVKNTRNYAKRQYTWFKNQFDGFDYILSDLKDINYDEIINKILK